MSGLVKRKDYCQFLLSSQINYTLTYFADHTTRFSHDAPTRYLRRDRITSKQIWQQAKRDLVLSKNGFIVFDDSVLDKNHSRHIELVYLVTGPNEGEFELVDLETTHNFEYVLTLRRRRTTPFKGSGG